MIRNFTQENLNTIIQFFNAINADDNDQIADQAQQLKGKYSKTLARVGGNGVLEAIVRDNRQIAAKKRSAMQKLAATFNIMANLDKPYGQDTFNDLALLQNKMDYLIKVNNVGSNSTNCNHQSFIPKTPGKPYTQMMTLLTKWEHEAISNKPFPIDMLIASTGKVKGKGSSKEKLPFLFENLITYSEKGSRNFGLFKNSIGQLKTYKKWMEDTTKIIYSALQKKVSKLRGSVLKQEEWEKNKLNEVSTMLYDTYIVSSRIADHEGNNYEDRQSQLDQKFMKLVGKLDEKQIINGSYYTRDQIYDQNGINDRMLELLYPADKYAYQSEGRSEDAFDCAYSVEYVSDADESHGLGATNRYNSYDDDQKGTIASLGGLDNVELGMELFQVNKNDDTIMEHVGKVVMHDFGNGPQKAVFQSTSVELSPDEWLAVHYGDTGPNITALENLKGETNWTHYANTGSKQNDIE